MAEEEKGFVIKDRRTFSEETGEPKAETSQAAKEDEAAEKETAKAEPGSAAEEDIQLPEVNFATFVFSLSSSAILHFGELPDPETGAKKENLLMAKHTIDILGMLEEKTKGNLTSDEAQLLKNVLYDLRMRYVRQTT